MLNNVDARQSTRYTAGLGVGLTYPGGDDIDLCLPPRDILTPATHTRTAQRGYSPQRHSNSRRTHVDPSSTVEDLNLNSSPRRGACLLTLSG